MRSLVVCASFAGFSRGVSLLLSAALSLRWLVLRMLPVPTARLRTILKVHVAKEFPLAPNFLFSPSRGRESWRARREGMERD